MKKTTLAAALAAALAASGGVNAAGHDTEKLMAELEALKAQVKALEAMVKDATATAQAQDREIAEIKSGEAGGDAWFNNVEIGGLVEFEAGYNDPDSGDSSSDLVIATAELAFAAQIHDWVGTEITLLYEEDDTDLEVDVATITIADPEGPWFTTVGQLYVPFGTYETNLVSDPLTLEIGETRESSIVVGAANNGFAGGVYVFNGDLDEGGDVEIDSFGAFAGYSQENANSSFAANIGYISNIGDSEGLQDTINDNLGGADFDDQVGGITVDGMFSTGPFIFIAEYTTATDEFTATELAFGTGGAEPSAFNVEAGYNFEMAGKDATVAAAYQQTDEAAALGLPEERIAAAISVEIFDATTLSFEWAHDDDYSASDGGTGEAGGDTVTGQIAVGF